MRKDGENRIKTYTRAFGLHSSLLERRELSVGEATKRAKYQGLPVF